MGMPVVLEIPRVISAVWSIPRSILRASGIGIGTSSARASVSRDDFGADSTSRIHCSARSRPSLCASARSPECLTSRTASRHAPSYRPRRTVRSRSIRRPAHRTHPYAIALNCTRPRESCTVEPHRWHQVLSASGVGSAETARGRLPMSCRSATKSVRMSRVSRGEDARNPQ